MKKILILESGAALAEIVNHLLAQSERFEVRRISPHTNEELCIVLQEYTPDLILMDDVVFEHNYTKLLVFLKAFCSFEIVVLHTQSNLLHRYTPQHIVLERASDLVSALAEGG